MCCVRAQPAVSVVQQLGVMKVTVVRQSYCANLVSIDRQFEGGNRQQVQVVEGVPGNCVEVADLVVSDLFASNVLLDQLAKRVTYCASPSNSVMSYLPSPSVCATLAVEFFTGLEGSVFAEGGNSPVAGVRIDYDVAGVLSGHTSTDATGQFRIDVQTSLVVTRTAEIRVTPSLTTDGITHRFTCLIYPGCTAVDNLVAEDERTYYISKNIRHASSGNAGFVFTDASSFVLQGKVTLPTTCDRMNPDNCYTLDERPCALPSVEICAYRSFTDFKLGECVISATGTGEYQIPVPIGSNVELRATLKLGENITALVQPATYANPYENTNVDLGTPVKLYRFPAIDAHKTKVDFEVWQYLIDDGGPTRDVPKDGFPTTIHVSGGICQKPLTRSDAPIGYTPGILVEITMPYFCLNYIRTELIPGGVKQITLDMPISDVCTPHDLISPAAATPHAQVHAAYHLSAPLGPPRCAPLIF